jgi:hypothetical protein
MVSVFVWAAWRIDIGHAQDQTVAGSLTVIGTADVEGDSLLLGAPAGLSGQPGLALHYGDGGGSGTPDQIEFTAVRPQTSWLWLYTVSGGAVQPQMWLDNTNVLTLYDRAATPNGAIQLNPSGTSLFAQSVRIGGADSRMPNQTLADPSSILTAALADGRYLSLAAAAAAYLTETASDARYLQRGPAGITTGSGYSVTNPEVPNLALPGGTVFGAGSIAGIQATASGYYAAALGTNSQATANFSTAVGYRAKATEEISLALGFNAASSGPEATAVGEYVTARGSGSTALGYGATAWGDGSIAIGTDAEADGGNSIASANFSTASANWSIASGYRATASGEYSSASGGKSTASGYRSIASGFGAVAHGLDSVAAGTFSSATGDYSTAIGYGAASSGDGAVASGYLSNASGAASVAAGPYTVATGSSQFVVGQYNAPQGGDSWVGTDDLFQVGNGIDANHRSNAFTVKKNGDAAVPGRLTVGEFVATHIDPQGDLSMGSFTTGQ